MKHQHACQTASPACYYLWSLYSNQCASLDRWSTSETLLLLLLVAPVLSQVRGLCKSKAAHGEVLGVCDKVRDDTLPQLGVRLEDRPDGECHS